MHGLVALVTLVALACTRPLEKPSPTRASLPSSSDAHAAVAEPSLRVEAAGESFLFHSWSFDSAATSFGIVDLAMHGSLTEALGAGGRVAINAGFFDTLGKPIGFAVSDGTVLSKYSGTMSGGVFYTAGGVAHLAASEEFDPETKVAFAMQCRPRLVVRGQANVRSDDGQRAERTALCIRDAGRTVDVIVAEPVSGTRGPSLFALGRFLAEQHHCEDALNLDGGPSTGAAYREGDASTPRVLPPRGPLRYAIVLR